MSNSKRVLNPNVFGVGIAEKSLDTKVGLEVNTKGVSVNWNGKGGGSLGEGWLRTEPRWEDC